MRGVCPLHGDMAPPTEQDLPVQKFLSEALAANVTLSATGTWYNGPSFLLPPGLWLISFHVTCGRLATTLERYYARIWDGSTALASSEATHPSMNPNYVNLAMTTVYQNTAQVTLTGQARCYTGGANVRMYAALPTLLDGNSTVLTAVKL